MSRQIYRADIVDGSALARRERDLFTAFIKAFREHLSRKAVQQFLTEKLEERRQEYGRFGATNFLLEPNVKRSRGGLRDIHLLQWVGLARYGTSSYPDLIQTGKLASSDAGALEEAQEFLRRVRNELHFHAGRAQDILTFDEQLRIAGCGVS